MEQTARERLEDKRAALLAERGRIAIAVALFAAAACWWWLVFGVLGQELPGGSPGFRDRFSFMLGPSTFTVQAWQVLLALLSLVLLLPLWCNHAWQRQHARIGRLLRLSGAGQLLLSGEAWDGVRGLQRAEPWLLLAAGAPPAGFELHLEYAARHWRVLERLDTSWRELGNALLPGALTRCSERVLLALYNYSVLWVFALFVLACLFPAVLFPSLAAAALFIGLTLLHVQARAAQLAIIEFLLE